MDQSLDGICLTMNHGFGLMTEAEQDRMREMYRPIYCHHVAPVLDALRDHMAENKARIEKLTDALAVISRIDYSRAAINGAAFDAVKIAMTALYRGENEGVL